MRGFQIPVSCLLLISLSGGKKKVTAANDDPRMFHNSRPHSIAPWPADQLELCFRVPLLARWQQRRRPQRKRVWRLVQGTTFFAATWVFSLLFMFFFGWSLVVMVQSSERERERERVPSSFLFTHPHARAKTQSLFSSLSML